MYKIIYMLTAAAALMAASGASAETVAGVQLPKKLRVDEHTLALSSCGVRDTLWVEHYVAALYVPPGMRAKPAVKDASVPKVLRVHVLTTEHFPEQLPEQWRKPLQASLRSDKFAKVSSSYKGLRSGDVMTFIYTPKQGLTMQVNRNTVVNSAHGVIDAMLNAWTTGEASSETLGNLLKGHSC
jgi:hypothetical protein